MKFIALLILAFLLTACQTIPRAGIQQFSELSQPPTEEGLVLIETISNSTHITGQLHSWNEIVIWKDDQSTNPDFYPLPGIYPVNKNSDSQLYAGFLKPGKYRLGYLFSEHNYSDMDFHIKALIPQTFASFEVKTGETIDLGTLVFHQTEYKGQLFFDLSNYIVFWSESNGNNFKRVSRLFNEKINKYGYNNAPESWQNNLAFDSESLMNSLSSATSIEATYRIDGNLFLLGKLGTIVNHTKGTSFRLGHHTLNALEKHGELYFAGGEFGSIYKFNLEGSVTGIISGIDPIFRVVDITAHDKNNIIATAISGDYTKFYKLNVEDGIAVPIYEFKDGYGRLHRDISFDFSEVVDNNLIVYSHSKKHTINLINKTNNKESLNIFKSGPMHNGAIRGSSEVKFFGRIKRNSHFSFSDQKWISFSEGKPSGSELQSTYPTDEKKAIGIFSKNKDKNYSAIVMITNDSGNSWSKISELPSTCFYFSYKASIDSELVVNCMDGSVVVSNDFGKTWNYIHATREFNFEEFPDTFKIIFTNAPTPEE